MSAIFDFYKGTGGNSGGWRLHEILAWSDAELEDVHDYIQWLFPLPEHSQANPFAPLLDTQTIQAFQQQAKLRAALASSLDRMLAFYGFQWAEEAGEKRIVYATNYAERAINWLTPGNHNHLRLTRMLRSLRILSLDAEAHALWEALQVVYATEQGSNAISQRTYNFWTRAATEASKRPG